MLGAAAESALLQLYAEVRLPESGVGALALDTVAMGGRPLQTTLDTGKRALIHQRLMELLEHNVLKPSANSAFLVDDDNA